MPKKKMTPSQVADHLVLNYGIEMVKDALEAEVEDAKDLEAFIVNESGPGEQIRFLVEEANYDSNRLIKIVKKYVKEG